MSEPNEVLREEELIAVQSIYGDDWHDIPPVKTPWGTEVEAGWWGVTVRAEDGRVSVQVRGRLNKKYPEQPPYLKLFEPIGLTGDHVRKLLKLLQDRARSLIGQVMIYELASFAENWIADNHVPMPKAGEPQRTLMEERALREEAQRAAEEAQSQAEYEKSLVAAAEQDRLLNEKIQLDNSLKKERKERAALLELEKRRLQSLEALDDGDLSSREVTLDTPITIKGFEGKWTSWCLYNGRKGMLWTTYDAEPIIKDGSVDPNFVKTDLPTLEVQVIDFSKPFYSSDQGKKRIDSLISEIKRLHEIQSDHVTLVHAVKRDKSPKGWERVMVFVERPKGVMLLRDWLPPNGFSEETAKEYYAQIMSGLQAVHRQNGTQRLFDSQFVTIHRPPNSQHIVKLLGTGYAKRIIDMHKSNPFLKDYHEINSESWASPDEMNHPHDYTTKRDIWNSAIFFVELLFGSQANWTYPNLTYLRENRTMSPSLYSLLQSILTDQAKKRPTAEEILDKLAELDSDTTRVPDRPQMISLTSTGSMRKGQNGHAQSPGDLHKTFSGGMPVPQHRFGPSRYKTDYEEVEKLGQGGFGMVVKARHRFDDHVYAVKKIKLRGDDRRRVTDKEIQILSVLSHKHIVRYFNCWIEDPVKPVGDEDTDSVDTASLPAIAAVDQISDPFAPPDPKDPFAYNTENSKSLSFPPVRFSLAAKRFDEMTSSDEDDDDDETDIDTEEEESSGEETESEHPIVRAKKSESQAIHMSSVTDTTNNDPSTFRTLYIAMEFVDNGTLRELIDSQLTVEESWRLFKEVLDALSYLHSQKVVHRDLKPSNILINADRRAIVADFGLSTFSAATVETVDPAQAGSITGTKTSNIGTAAYIAPEVMSGRSYDEKADLYSLGVIFFEMNFPPMMGQERAHIINGIRNPSISFPSSWPAERDKQHDVIRWLLAHDPASRPSADVALASPLMPMELKTPAEYHKVIADLTADRKSDRFKQLLKAMFQPAQTGPVDLVEVRADNWLYDHEPGPNEEATEVWSAVIVKRLKDLFHRHGAQETYLPPLIPETKLLDSFPNIKPVRLLDHSGRLVQLVGCGLVAMARSAPRRRVGRRKRFHLGMEHVEIMSGRQPAKSAELSFDIVSPLRSAAAEVEMIEVVDKVIAEFRGGKSAPEEAGYEFHISHESVLSAILDLVPSQHRTRVSALFRSIGVDFNYDKSKEKVKSVLKGIKGFPPHVINSLEACVLVGDFADVRSKLELIFASANHTARDRLKRALEETAVIMKLLSCISIGRRVLFRPTLSHNAEFFKGGFMFECVRKGRRRDVLAYGGRYDALLEHFDIARSYHTTTYGVGMSISVDHLAQMVSGYESALARDLMAREKEEERSFGFWTPSRCDVYVAAGVQVDLSVRVKIIAELWRNGISADLQYDDDRTLEDLTAECEDQSTPFLVLPRANRSEVKIRSILRKSEEEVSRNDLCSHLRALISEQKRIDATYASIEGSIPSSQAAVHSVEPRQEHKLDIRLILPPEPQTSKGTKGRPIRKHRHGTKSVYYDKTYEFSISTKSTIPIIAVDLPLPLLSRLTLHQEWVSDDEPWKTILASLATSERKYADTVREGVRKLVKDDGCGVFWLFGVREGRGFLMQVR